MGMAAILVMWPGPFEQIFIPPSHGDSIWNLAPIGLDVSEEKTFKEDGQTSATEAYLSYKLSNEPLAQVSLKDQYKHRIDGKEQIKIFFYKKMTRLWSCDTIFCFDVCV